MTRSWTPAIIALGALLAALAGCAPEERVVNTSPMEIDADGITLLKVGIDDGDLLIQGDPDVATIAADIILVTTRKSSERDTEALTDMVVQLRALEDGEAMLSVIDPGIDKYRANAEVVIPADMMVSIADENGFVQVMGCGSVDIDDTSDDLEISDITGDVVVVDTAGEISVAEVVGNVVLDDGKDDLYVEGVDGDVEIDDAGGDIFVTDVTGTVTIRDGAGQMSIDDVGSVVIE
jgi:hypothetical protein